MEVLMFFVYLAIIALGSEIVVSKLRSMRKVDTHKMMAENGYKIDLKRLVDLGNANEDITKQIKLIWKIPILNLIYELVNYMNSKKENLLILNAYKIKDCVVKFTKEEQELYNKNPSVETMIKISEDYSLEVLRKDLEEKLIKRYPKEMLDEKILTYIKEKTHEMLELSKTNKKKKKEEFDRKMQEIDRKFDEIMNERLMKNFNVFIDEFMKVFTEELNFDLQNLPKNIENLDEFIESIKSDVSEESNILNEMTKDFEKKLTDMGIGNFCISIKQVDLPEEIDLDDPMSFLSMFGITEEMVEEHNNMVREVCTCPNCQKRRKKEETKEKIKSFFRKN